MSNIKNGQLQISFKFLSKEQLTYFYEEAGSAINSAIIYKTQFEISNGTCLK